jgi:hypothetical protein
MRLLRTTVLCLSVASSWAWGAEDKASLDQARANYQQSVARYGKNSPQAKTAKNNLRNARHTFHSTRRQRQHKHAGTR